MPKDVGVVLAMDINVDVLLETVVDSTADVGPIFVASTHELFVSDFHLIPLFLLPAAGVIQ